MEPIHCGFARKLNTYIRLHISRVVSRPPQSGRSSSALDHLVSCPASQCPWSPTRLAALAFALTALQVASPALAESTDSKLPSTKERTLTTANAPRFENLRVLPIGDSMTAGDDDYPTSFRSYRGPLYNLLKAAGHDIDFVGPNHLLPATGGDPDHAAVGGAHIGPGRSANNAFDRVDLILGGVGEVDVVIVAMGWNSVFDEPAEAAGKYEGLIKRLISMRPKATIVVATLSPPRDQTENEAAARSLGYRELNAKARRMAAASPTDRLLLADLAAAPFSVDDFWDVIHWHQSGADKAARVIFRTLTENAAVINGNR